MDQNHLSHHSCPFLVSFFKSSFQTLSALEISPEGFGILIEGHYVNIHSLIICHVQGPCPSYVVRLNEFLSSFNTLPFQVNCFFFVLPLKFLWFRENSAWNDSKREAFSKWWLFALSVLRSGELPACRMKPCSFSSVSLLTQQAVPASHNVLVVNEWQRWQTNRALKKKKKRNKSRR